MNAAVVTITDKEIECKRPTGLVEKIVWEDLQEVQLVTGDFLEPSYWLLVGTQSGCVVPFEAEGADQLLEKLQTLSGFNNHALINAMTSTEPQKILCWKK